MKKLSEYIADLAAQQSLSEYAVPRAKEELPSEEDEDEDDEDSDESSNGKKQSKNNPEKRKGRTLTGQPISQINLKPELKNVNLFRDNSPLREEAEKHAVVAWGRMNPVTVGHEKLVNKVKETAEKHGADPHVFLTRTQDKKKNPLPYTAKYALARKAFGSVVKPTPEKDATIIGMMKHLHKRGYHHVTMVAGSDRVEEYHKLLHKYNGPESEYNFKSIKVVSAGHRDPDADGAEGISASKMREHAANNNHEHFKKGLPSGLQKHSKTVMNMVRDHMGKKLDEQSLQEVLNVQQRLKKAAKMRAMKQRLRSSRKRAMQRKASRPTIMKRSRRLAVKFLKARILRNRKFSDLSLTAREALERRLALKPRVIARLAKRLLPRVAQAETRRKLGGRFISPSVRGMGLPMGSARPTRRPIHPGQRYNTLHNSIEFKDVKNLIGEAFDKIACEFGPSKKIIQALVDKSEKNGIPYPVLEQVYNRGKFAYLTGERHQELTAEQFAFNRVNSFISGGRARTLDTDLWEEGGAGYEGTPELVKKLKKDTPGQNVAEESKIKRFKNYMAPCSEAIEAPYDATRSAKLTMDQAEQMRRVQSPSWDMVQGHHLQKKFMGRDHVDIEMFTQAVNKAAVQLDHFPELSNFYNEVTVKVGTTDVDGLTAIDFSLASKIDSIATALGLKETE